MASGGSDAAPLRLAVCITGQLGRLELDTKLRHLLRPLAPHADIAVFLVVESGSTIHFSNPKKSAQGHGCAFEPTPQSVVKRLAPYLSSHWIGPREEPAVNMTLFPRYRAIEENRHEVGHTLHASAL